MPTPENVCGYRPDLPDDWDGASPVDGVTFSGEYCCFRSTHDETDRCIWHSRRSRKQITETTLDRPNIDGDGHVKHVEEESALSNRSRIIGAERIDDAFLENSRIKADLDEIHFYNSRLRDASFFDVDLEFVTFTHCLLDDAKFLKCRIGATISQSSACLTEFRDSEFTGMKTSESAFIGVRFYGCDFKASSFESPEFSREVLFCGCSIDHATTFDDIRIENSGTYEYEAQMKVYGQLADMCLSSREISKYIKYKKQERYAEGRKQLHDIKSTDQYRHDFASSLVNYLSHEYSRVTMGYGYSVGRVLLTMLTVLLLGTIIYTGLECQFGSLYGVSYGCESGWALLKTFGDSFYFSVMSFTTTGYGDISPLGWARVVAGVQTLSGLIIGAQLVYVLATKTSM